MRQNLNGMNINKEEEDRKENVKMKKEYKKQIRGTKRGRMYNKITEIELENKKYNY